MSLATTAASQADVPRASLLQTLFLGRFPLVFLLGYGLVPLGIERIGTALFGNIFVIEQPNALTLVTWLAFPPAWIAGLSLHLILRNQRARFDAAPHPALTACFGGAGWRVLLASSLFVLPLLWRLVVAFEGPNGPWSWGVALGIGAALAAGTAAAVLFRGQLARVARAAQRRLVPWTEPLQERLERALVGALARLGPGYVEGERPTRRLAPGHVPALTLLGLVIAFALLTRRAFDFQARNYPDAPTLLMVELLAAFAASALPALSFFLDRWRIPLLLPLVAYLALVARLWDTDARFDVVPAASGPPGAPGAPLARDGELPIVIVCAAGGGIQAAAWTSAVLVGLQQELGDAFSRSVRLVSGVSGGSVGLMHTLAAVTPEGTLPVPAATTEPIQSISELPAVYRGATTSSLFATSWGIVHGDAPRAFLPALATGSRGSAQEQAWAWNVARISAHDAAENASAPYTATFGDLARALETRALPAVVFQSTVVETGEPFLVSNVALDPAAGVPAAPQFHATYPGLDLAVVTAARLSASFPYVSPTPRAKGPAPTSGVLSQVHFADGGYVENYGVLGALAWMRSVRPELVSAARAGRPIVVLRIDPFVPEPGCDPPSRNGWVNEITAPVRTVLNARGPSQRTIGDGLLQAWREDPAFQPGGEPCFHVLRIRPEAPADPRFAAAGDQPNTLSWHLSSSERLWLWDIWRATAAAARAPRREGELESIAALRRLHELFGD